MSSPERRKEQQTQQQQGQGAQRGQAQQQQQRGREGEAQQGQQGQQKKAEASQFSYEYMIPGYGAGMPQKPSLASSSGTSYQVPLTGGFAPSMGMGSTAYGPGFPMQNTAFMSNIGATPGMTGGMAGASMSRQNWAMCHVTESLSELESIVSFILNY